MNIVEYANEIADKIRELRPDLNLNVKENLRKNNGTELTGIIISREGSNISPVIYVNFYYENEHTVEEAVKEIMDVYNNSERPAFDVNPETLCEFDKAKEKIVAKIVNKDKNQPLLTEVPYAEFGDMIVVFSIMVQSDMNNFATVMVTNNLMNTWGINLAQLIEIAYENTKKILPMEIGSMGDILCEMFEERDDLDEEQKKELLEMQPQVNMYVVTNKYKRNGSSYMTDRESLLDIAKKINNDKFYILPSSIHEFIIVPCNDTCPKEDDLMAMVKEVNATQVAYDEVLADNVYKFDAGTEELSMVSTNTVIPFIA